MNYFIEKHDMQIILDALELLYDRMERFPTDYEYSQDDVDGLFQAFDNSVEDDEEEEED